MKVKLFTHTDLDGVTPDILCRLVFDEVSTEFCSYINIDKRVKNFLEGDEWQEYDMIYITDISVKEEVAELIQTTCPDKLLLFDHHITADWLNKYSWAFVKDKEPYIAGDKVLERKSCGASLFHTYLIKERYLSRDKEDRKTDDFVERVRRYDTWDWFEMKDLSAKRLSMLLDILGKKRFITKYIDFVGSFDTLWFDEADMLLLELEQEKIDRYVEDRRHSIIEVEIQGNRTGVVFAEQYKSELGNRLAEITNYDIIAIIDPTLSVSFRCKKECTVDLSKIAEVYQGGGHPKAAGFPLEASTKMDIIKAILCKEEK